MINRWLEPNILSSFSVSIMSIIIIKIIIKILKNTFYLDKFHIYIYRWSDLLKCIIKSMVIKPASYQWTNKRRSDFCENMIYFYTVLNVIINCEVIACSWNMEHVRVDEQNPPQKNESSIFVHVCCLYKPDLIFIMEWIFRMITPPIKKEKTKTKKRMRLSFSA